MKIFKYILSFGVALGATLALTSCSDDDFTPTIFPDGEDTLDPNSYTYKFDKWLKQEFLDVYNLDFRYKMQDVGTDLDYNLVPAEYDKAVDLAVLVKYLWFDAYKEVVDPEFLKKYGPRILHLIGSPAYNPQTGSMVLGLAEGGIKVSLFRVNYMNLNDFAQLNEFYFQTMHHEFSHILHQAKSIPTEFRTISNGRYDDNNWTSQVQGRMNSLGFVTNYASSQMREDFAETIATYIVYTDAQWERVRELAARGWESPGGEETTDVASYYCFYYYPNNDAEKSKSYVNESEIVKESDEEGNVSYRMRFGRDDQGNPLKVYPVEDLDGIDGVAVLDQKINVCRNWLRDEWNVDLDKLRAEVQKRQSNYNIEDLRRPVDEMK